MPAAAAQEAPSSNLVAEVLQHKGVMEKTKAAIEKLVQQNEQLKDELLLANKSSVKPANAESSAIIQRLIDESDLYSKKIEMAKRKVIMLDSTLEVARDTLKTTRSKMGGINASVEEYQATQKRIKRLENRLEQVYKKTNGSIAYNRELKAQIENMRREKIMSEGILNSLQRELERVKIEMTELITTANQTFNAKEKVNNEIQNVKRQFEKEQMSYEDEWKYLTRLIEEDKKASDDKRAAEMAERQRKTQALLKGKTLLSPPSSKQSARASAHAIKPLSAAAHRDKLAMYTEAFARVQEATEIDDIDELIRTFLSAEDENYTLFNYVNEVNDEIERLEGSISTLSTEIDHYRGSGAMSAQAQLTTAKAVADTLSRTEGLQTTYGRRYEAALKTVELLKDSIMEIFNKVGCNTPAVRDMLGDEEIYEGNMLSYLGIIEQRTNELLQAYAMYKDSKAMADPLHDTLRAPAVCSLGTRILVEPPSSRILPDQEEEESDVDEDGPMSREAITQRLAKTLPGKLDTAIRIRPAASRKPKPKAFRG